MPNRLVERLLEQRQPEVVLAQGVFRHALKVMGPSDWLSYQNNVCRQLVAARIARSADGEKGQGEAPSRERGKGKEGRTRPPSPLPFSPCYGRLPDQRQNQPDLRQVGEPIGHRLYAELHQPDRRQKHSQIPEPADQQVRPPSPDQSATAVMPSKSNGTQRADHQAEM